MYNSNYSSRTCTLQFISGFFVLDSICGSLTLSVAQWFPSPGIHARSVRVNLCDQQDIAEVMVYHSRYYTTKYTAFSFLNHLLQGKPAALSWRYSQKPTERHTWQGNEVCWQAHEDGSGSSTSNDCSPKWPHECNLRRDPQPKWPI